MLSIRDLYAGYGKSEVLQGVSLDVPAGKVVTLIGANGAGKTTTLKALCGQLKYRGDITFDGQPLNGLATHEIVERGITMIPEGRQLFPFLTVRDNLLMGAYKRQARSVVDRRLDEVLTLFPRVRERLEQFAGSLSGGEQQMVAIARGMMACPRLLMFDEPSLGLSPLLVEEMFTLIQKLNDDGLTIMLVEQNVVQSLELASRAYIIENGKVAMSGQASVLAEDPELRRTYLGL